MNGALIGRRRTEMGLTQAELASRVGIHWVTQSNIENGKALVSLELVERFADEIEVSREQLLGEPDAEAASMTAATADFAQAIDRLLIERVSALVEQRLREFA